VSLKRYFEITTLSEAVARIKKDDVTGPLAAVTFDDGYRDNYLYAWPVLKSYKIPATIFLTADYIGAAGGFWWDTLSDIVMNSTVYAAPFGRKAQLVASISRRLRLVKDPWKEIDLLERRFRPAYPRKAPREMLNRDEIKEMADSGMDFGSHGLSHKNLTISGDAELDREVRDSKMIIEEIIKRPVEGFSYPFGDYDERTVNSVRDAGYLYARTCDNGFNICSDDIFRLRRVDALTYNIRDFLARLSFRRLAV
jgi:peptidoglycan/xylan/chitin deacetylase (PgdA/CDA1 family)